MSPPKCPDCVFRYDRPDLWESCMDCADDDPVEIEVPGEDDEGHVLEVDDEVVDAVAYGCDVYDFDGEIYD